MNRSSFALLLGCVLWTPITASAVEVGDAAPGMEQWDGKVVVVNFWASWCAPCRAELPLLDDLHVGLDGEVATVVGVNIDKSERRAQALTRHLDLQMPTLMDPDAALAAQYEPPTMPTTFIIGPDGTIAAVHEGAVDDASLESLRCQVEALLKPPTVDDTSEPLHPGS